jgi:hypothetical protein
VIDAAALLIDTKSLVRMLVDDLRISADPTVISAEYDRAKDAHRTSLPRPQWAEGLHAQVAVSWVLGCVFIRFCEDNGLVDDALLGGPGNRRDLAREQRAAYLRDHSADDDREWLRQAFSHYRALPATGDVFGDHNPLWLLAPSADGARRLVEAFQRIDPATGLIAHDFTDPAWDTRFLGDLYQDLSEHAKQQYALFQTPIFVEEFILDHTLDPALATFGLCDTDLIDPTCGSGHFLLGAFQRLFDRWVDTEPATNRRELARRALDAVAGVDINAFAAGVARFRLLVAALRAGGDRRLVNAPNYPIHIAIGDSLLHRTTQLVLDGAGRDDDLAAAAAHGYAIEDAEAARGLLSRRWAVVVGNPPYITVKDPALNDLYRKRYPTCRGKYSLGVPFMERFWQLARHDREPERAGYVGMITANSFMKREMGKNLIERWFPAHDLTRLLDTSGVPIPGHGTGSVILFGRSRMPVSQTVRALLKKGDDPHHAGGAASPSWRALLDQFDDPGSESEYFSAVDFPRKQLAGHPWSLGGGGGSDLKQRLDRAATGLLESGLSSVGFYAITGEDEFFLRHGSISQRRRDLANIPFRLVAGGDAVRDWRLVAADHVVFPYKSDLRPLSSLRESWPYRQVLRSGLMFGRTRSERGLANHEYAFLSKEREQAEMLITFASVATHNHFAIADGGCVLKQSAPAILALAGLDEPWYYRAVALLNSSTACFWLKQVMYPKGGDGVGRGIQDEAWETRYDFDGTKLKRFPVVDVSSSTAELLCDLGTAISRVSPARLVESHAPTRDALSTASKSWTELRAQMVAAQERLDWEVYRSYGIVTQDLTTGDEPEPPLSLGERAFEIVLARKMAAGKQDSSWFTRHGSKPLTVLPEYWSEPYRQLVEQRIALIESDVNVGLIERPEYKRRWSSTPWQDQQRSALRDWLLDRLESPAYWPEPAAITTTARLAAQARTDDDFMTVARLWAEREDVDIAAVVNELVTAEAVPYLAAFRYTDSGLRKWAQWLQTWALQRREDAGEDVGDIPVPPRYTSADFQGVVWTQRGKLDVPKERFISYPGAQRETDTSLSVGWAGWDHLERARTLATGYLQAKRDGRDREHLRPLLAGLAELVPWLLQWHDEANADPSLDRPGSQIAALVDAELRSLHLVPDDLTSWRPAPARRGRSR